jgi:hypothetical protein
MHPQTLPVEAPSFASAYFESALQCPTGQHCSSVSSNATTPGQRHRPLQLRPAQRECRSTDKLPTLRCPLLTTMAVPSTALTSGPSSTALSPILKLTSTRTMAPSTTPVDIDRPPNTSRHHYHEHPRLRIPHHGSYRHSKQRHLPWLPAGMSTYRRRLPRRFLDLATLSGLGTLHR